MNYSIVVPVYNRPDEVDELLESLCSQTLKDFEVVVVEDGSQKPCKDVCDKYASILDLHYYYKDNSGPGQSRNYGVERAHGQYVVILDSDVVTPPDFIQSIDDELRRQPYERVCIFAHAGVLVCAGIYGGLFARDDAFAHQVDYGGIEEIEL